MNFRIINSNIGCLFHQLISIFYSDVSQIEVFEINHWIHAQAFKYRYLFRRYLSASEMDVTTVTYSSGSGIWAHFSEQRQRAFVIWIQVNIANMESLTIYTQQIHYEGTIAPLASCPSCPSLDSSQCVNRKDKRVLQGMIAREKKKTTWRKWQIT